MLCHAPAGDLSTNCWWVAAVSFGEGWHNSHHAFPYSARHGLEWWELDPTWYLICILKALGLVWDVQVCRRIAVYGVDAHQVLAQVHLVLSHQPQRC